MEERELMDINEQDQPEKDLEETFADDFGDPDSPDSNDIFGEPELFPRVGNEYQAAIPVMLTPSERLKYLSNPCDSQPNVDVSHNFLIGLPVPITWVHNEAKAVKDEGIEVHDNVDCSRMEPNQNVTESSGVSDKKNSDVKGDCVDQRCVTSEYGVIPQLPADSWSDFEVDCFLLGLYFFGKNLLQVKRFMESKEMGQILSFYYGRFFRSAKYQRWADCRKTKGRKCIIGQRLLTGSRQQELFSRLLPQFSEESRNTSVEAYKAFTDGRTLLEEYVSTLKNMVGIHALVEAVGIGKCNEDLTVMAMESSRTNHSLPSRPEMPSGKACSSLTYEEIIKYLTGDFRLSKARSNDLFWEAVWPRLLAKGWHSEKPKDEVYRCSKNCLVFLVPGIKRFRRKLLKGDHYFDSVSDVLKKVASEPELLVLETEENGVGISEKENGCGTEPNSDEDGGSDHDHNRYLKPRFSSEAANHMKFTVVDTSLFHEDEPSKVRELRSLPVEMKTSSTWVRRTGVGDQEKAINPSDRLKDLIVYNHSNKRMANNTLDRRKKPAKNHLDHRNAYLSADKRQRLTACPKAEKKSMEQGFPQPSVARTHNCVLSLPAPSKRPVRRSNSHAQTHAKVSPTSSLVLDKHGEKSQKGEPATSIGSSVRSQPLIDLNVPQAPAEPELNGQVVKVKVEESNDIRQNGSNDISQEPVGGSTVDGICSDEQANVNARRQSTRSRPMSTKALEALESSFFNPKTAKKRPPGDAQDDKPRVSRRPRTKSSMPGNCTVDAQDGIHSSVNDVLSDALT